MLSDDCYKLVESSVSHVGKEEVLVRAKFISVDPYMRIQQSVADSWEKPHPLNTVTSYLIPYKSIRSKEEMQWAKLSN